VVIQSSLLQKAARTTFFVALLATGITPALAYSTWTAPTAAPPGNNTDTPINAGATAQTKTGQFVLSLPSTFNSWALSVSGAQYGIYSGNSAGYYTELDNSSWGIYTNGNILTAGNLYSGSGGSFFANNGDQYMGYSGQYLSTVLGWNGSTYNINTGNQGHKSGAGFGTGPSGCFIADNWTGGCSCPGFAPNAQLIMSMNDHTGSWYASYVCYGS
jgi:hypothetical protein